MAVILHIHQYDIRSHLFDIPPEDRIIRFTFKPVKKRTAAGDNDLADLSAALVKLKIRHSAQPLAVLDIDHFLGLKFRIKHLLSPKNAFLYYMRRIFFRFPISSKKVM